MKEFLTFAGSSNDGKGTITKSRTPHTTVTPKTMRSMAQGYFPISRAYLEERTALIRSRKSGTYAHTTPTWLTCLMSSHFPLPFYRERRGPTGDSRRQSVAISTIRDSTWAVQSLLENARKSVESIQYNLPQNQIP